MRRSVDGAFLADTFTRLDDARLIAEALILRDPEQRFPFLTQARIAYLLQQPALTLRGEACDAYIARASVQGAHRLLWQFLAATFAPFDRWTVDFVVYVDAAAWQRREWEQELGPTGFPIQREALIYHELCHLRHLQTGDGEPRFGEDGRPMLALTRHTYEFFAEEIRRYGPATLDLVQVGGDFTAGAEHERKRRRRGTLRAV